MSIKVWPFLVSRNPYLDYRTVVAPDFICEAKIPNLLARVAEGDLTEPGQAIIRQVVNSKVGVFNIVFQVIKATEKDINSTGENNILKDQFGREIYMFEGIVARKIGEDFIISDGDFQEVHQQLTASYRKFWDLVDPSPAIPSQSFSLDMDSVSSRLVLKRLETLEIRTETPTPQPEQVKQLKQPKSSKIPVTVLVPLVLILMFAIGILFRKALFGNTISLGCATTLEDTIKFERGDKITDKFKQSQEEYSGKTSMYISGSLEVEDFTRFRNLKNKESSSKSEKLPTIKVYDDNRLEMNYHPIELAITDIKDEKANNNSEIRLRIIDRGGCPDS